MPPSTICLLLAMALSAAVPAAAPSDPYRADVDAWHAQRIERLQAEDGWLSLVGLHPLHAGVNTVGTATDRDVRLDAEAPGKVGVLDVGDDGICFTPEAGVPVRVDGVVVTGPVPAATDTDGAPTVFQLGTVRFHVIARGDLRFLRVKDGASPVRRGFTGIARFPVDPRWRVTARLVTEDQPTEVPSVNVLGQTELLPSPGRLEFEVDGQTYRLLPTGGPGEPLFIVFSDGTSGRLTYGGGRFLSTPPPDADGRVELDFNRAINPPCAFTPHATCPLPPPENRLPLAVTAGEKTWGDHH
ncbi:MAG: DUF1684 domain-containing protein [Candidatus Krumholzibacteriia bacterium]